MAAEQTVAAPAFNLTAADPALPFIAAAPVTTNRASVSLEWDASPDPNTVGYRIYFWTEDRPGHAQSADAGNRLKATVSGLPEGVRVIFCAVSYAADNTEGPLSNEASTVTPVYIGLVQDRWAVVSYGLFGKTNQLQTSDNLSDWQTALEWVGDGTERRLLHTNQVKAWFRVREK